MPFARCMKRWLAVVSSSILMLAGCGPGVIGSGTGGHVVSTDPTDGATGVPPDTTISITFSSAAAPDSIDGDVGPTIDFDLVWSADGKTVTITPANPLEPDTEYTVTITDVGFTDGSRLAEPHTLRFTVGGGDGDGDGDGHGAGCTPMECPFVDPATSTMAVVCTTPTPCSTNVSRTDPLIVEFTIPFDLNDLGADILSETGQSFDVDVSQSEDGTMLVITPTAPLLENHTYAIVIDYVGDTEGNRTGIDGFYCFSTGAELNCPSPPECQEHDATDGGVRSFTDFDYSRPFADQSIWNTPIGDDPEIDPDSDVMIARFVQVHDTQGGIDISVRHDSVPVYIADADTPRVTVTLTDVYAIADEITNVPLPDEALPDCGFDTLLGAYDPETGIFYEFWRARKLDDGSWQAASGNSIDASSGSGIYPGNGVDSSDGIRASGYSLLGGMIWPHELQAGVIDHAIAFYYFPTRTGGPVPPAVASDGAVDDPAALPIGAHLQLDPDLDLDALGLDPWERTIAEALQVYGMFCADTGGGIGLSMLHAYSFEGNPYDGLLPEEVITEGDVLLNKLPPDQFHVLSPRE